VPWIQKGGSIWVSMDFASWHGRQRFASCLSFLINVVMQQVKVRQNGINEMWLTHDYSAIIVMLDVNSKIILQISLNFNFKILLNVFDSILDG
jgi:hypothetical protein